MQRRQRHHPPGPAVWGQRRAVVRARGHRQRYPPRLTRCTGRLPRTDWTRTGQNQTATVPSGRARRRRTPSLPLLSTTLPTSQDRAECVVRGPRVAGSSDLKLERPPAAATTGDCGSGRTGGRSAPSGAPTPDVAPGSERLVELTQGVAPGSEGLGHCWCSRWAMTLRAIHLPTDSCISVEVVQPDGWPQAEAGSNFLRVFLGIDDFNLNLR